MTTRQKKWHKKSSAALAGLPNWASDPALPRSPHCPVTGGRQTKLATDTYRRLCLARRHPNLWVCVQCHGGQNPPAELELTDTQTMITEINREKIMVGSDREGDTMSTYGNCEICGYTKKIRNIRGKNACSTCEHIWRAANVQPEQVLRMLAEAKGDDYLRRTVGEDQVIPIDECRCEPQRHQSDVVIERIITSHNLASGTDVAAFVDNLAAEIEAIRAVMRMENRGVPLPEAIEALRDYNEDHARRLHAAEQVIETIRAKLDLDQEQSILEAVAQLQRDRQKATDIWFETLGVMGADVAIDADNLPLVARNIMSVNNQLKQQVSTARDERDAVASELSDAITRIGNIRTSLGAAPDDDLVQRAEMLFHAADLFVQTTDAFGIDGQDGEDAPQLAAELVNGNREMMVKMQELRDLLGLAPDSFAIYHAVSQLLRERQEAIDVLSETAREAGIIPAFGGLGELPKFVSGLIVERDQLAKDVNDMKEGNTLYIGDCEPCHLHTTVKAPDDRLSSLLDLALDVIAGRVSGLDAERIAALR